MADLRIHLCKRGREPEQFDVAALAGRSAGFSGAEIEQAIVSALHEAFASKSDLTTDLIAKALRQNPRLVLGLGPRTKVDWIEVRWPPPSGKVERFVNPPVDRYITIVEGEGKWV